MPRKSQGPKLYLDPVRKTWSIRDGKCIVRTGCAEDDLAGAQQALGAYIGRKFEPERGLTPSIDEILLVYTREVIPDRPSARKLASDVKLLLPFWSGKQLADVTKANCRAFWETRAKPKAARNQLNTLRAAINYYNESDYGPLPMLPRVFLPEDISTALQYAPRQRWLTVHEAVRLLRTAKNGGGEERTYLVRFILLGLYTGTRSEDLREMQWSWIDFDSGMMQRRAPGEAERDTKRSPPVKLGSRILAHLRRWKRIDNAGPNDHVVRGKHGYVPHIGNPFNRAVERAGLDRKVTPHTLRRPRASV
jgi:integrase